MAYLLSEILIGLIVMAIAGFCLGWVLRGIRERIRNRQVEN
jgi:NhaP-type Na+/H+ or K+/H+ antiporter